MQTPPLQPFHLAFPVNDLDRAETFYVELLGCQTGRRSDKWIDFSFYGHQIVAHLCKEEQIRATNQVDGEAVPVRHFGIILNRPEWQALSEKLRQSNHLFLIEPQIRFEGQPGEQGTFFIEDPAGNALEFKYFDDPRSIFDS